jgi:hypothetical protein
MRAFFTIFCTMYASSALSSDGSSTTALYNLDLFSIISFGLAIASIILALFSMYLSWKFYVESQRSSEKTSASVSKIELIAFNIEGNIKTIVEKTMTYLMSKGDAAYESTTESTQIYTKLSELISLLEKKPDSDNNIDIANTIEELRKKFENFENKEKSYQIKNLFSSPDDSIKNVSYNKFAMDLSHGNESGIITVTVSKPMPVATVIIYLERSTKENLNINLKSSDNDINNEIEFKTVRIGPHSFSIHIYSKGLINPGEYRFIYNVK